MGLLAHQGGWDEILLVLAPLGIFALLLVAANRRAGALRALAEPASDGAVSANDVNDADELTEPDDPAASGDDPDAARPPPAPTES